MKRFLVVLTVLLTMAASVFADGMPVSQDDFFKAVGRDDVSGARTFLDQGTVGINDKNTAGLTGLMIAIQRKNLPMVIALMTYRPDLTVTDDAGKTALDYAAESGNLAIQNAVK